MKSALEIMCKLRLQVAACLFFLFCNVAKGQSVDSLLTGKKALRTYETKRLTGIKPKIDGVLNDACWNTGAWAGDFTQWIPKEGAAPSQKTELKILYDDQNIYVAIRAYDNEPDKIEKRASRRDELFGDMVGVCFDSYHDHRTGFEFDITAAGQKTDAVLTNPWNADLNWNAVWDGKVAMEDSAWTAEMLIPLSQLRYSGETDQVWGLHCWRWINRLQEESDWEIQTSTGPGMLYLFGELKGISNLKKARRIELLPYSLGKISMFEKDGLNPYAKNGYKMTGSFGLNAKVGLSSNFTLDLAVNPDFGQVESDPSVMNLSAFEVFYEEKRPFFLEGKSIFNFELNDANIFYSRRIGQTPNYIPNLLDNEYVDMPDNTNILSAVKVSGKNSKGLSVGILHSFTAKENAYISRDGVERKLAVEPFTSYLVGRVQQDFKGGNSVLGAVVTSTNRSINEPQFEFMNNHAYTGGIDVLHQWKDKEFYVNARLIGSQINGSEEAIQNLQMSSAHFYQRPDADYLEYDSTRTSLGGYGGNLKVGKGSKGRWRYSTAFNWMSPGLDLNDIGYMQTADIVNQENAISYFDNEPDNILRKYEIGVNQFNNWNFNFDHLYSGISGSLYLEFLNKWNFSSELKYSSEKLDMRLLRGGSAVVLPSNWNGEVSWNSDNSKKVFFGMNYNFSYSAESSLSYWAFGPELTVTPFNTLKLAAELEYSSNKDEMQFVDIVDVENSNTYILGRIDQETLWLTFRIDYNITPELSIQYYGSPFASIGRYSSFKDVNNPASDSYRNQFTVLDDISKTDREYQVDENSDGSIDYSFGDPDFDFYQFRSNMVFRWEYKPGSQLFFVWSNERTNFINPGFSDIGSTARNLSDAPPNNIFLIKLNYWFAI